MPRIVARLTYELPTWGSQWQIDETPEQQFDSLTEVYAAGETLTYDRQFKPLVSLGSGIWELKTADLRIFGWFHQRDCFVATNLDLADRIKMYRMYAGYVGEAVRDRDALTLDEPKFIEGDNPHDVVSAFDYP